MRLGNARLAEAWRTSVPSARVGSGRISIDLTVGVLATAGAIRFFDPSTGRVLGVAPGNAWSADVQLRRGVLYGYDEATPALCAFDLDGRVRWRHRLGTPGGTRDDEYLVGKTHALHIDRSSGRLTGIALDDGTARWTRRWLGRNGQAHGAATDDQRVYVKAVGDDGHAAIDAIDDGSGEQAWRWSAREAYWGASRDLFAADGFVFCATESALFVLSADLGTVAQQLVFRHISHDNIASTTGSEVEGWPQRRS